MTIINELPAPIPTTTRDREIERFKRSYLVRVPGADVGDNSPVDTDARVCADILMPLYATARINNDQTILENARGKAQEQWAERFGVAPRRDAYGASGAVVFAGNTGGSTILADDELKHETTGLRYRIITTDHYTPGSPIGLVGFDTGPATNLPAGTQLKWVSPRPGCSDYALVGTGGLTGGRNKENDDEFLLRIQQELQTRAASGNDAEYQLEIESTPNVATQKAFTWPAAMYAGTIAWAFTVLPEYPGGSRCPNSTQYGLVESHLAGEFPGDDGAMPSMLANQNIDVTYKFDFAEGAADWIDLAPWPRYYAVAPSSGPGAIRVSSATSATSFTLATSNAVYTNVIQPLAGQTICFSYRSSTGIRFVRKRILSFTGTGPWVVTCDTTNNASDTSYTPEVGQRACPWSDSLPATLYRAPETNATGSLVEPASGILSYFDTLGPGEQVSTFYDDGVRQRRQPQPPSSWPHTTTTRGLIDALDRIEEVADVDVLEGDDVAPAVGSPGVLAYVLLPRWIAAFPKT